MRIVRLLLVGASGVALASAAPIAVADPSRASSLSATSERVEETEHAAKVEREERAFRAALFNLDSFMKAGSERNVGLGAELMSSYQVNSHRAIADTRQLYREQEELLAGYRSISSDIYGYEFDSNRFALSVEFEGRIETTKGMSSEFSARMVFRENKWLIDKLLID